MPNVTRGRAPCHAEVLRSTYVHSRKYGGLRRAPVTWWRIPLVWAWTFWVIGAWSLGFPCLLVLAHPRRRDSMAPGRGYRGIWVRARASTSTETVFRRARDLHRTTAVAVHATEVIDVLSTTAGHRRAAPLVVHGSYSATRTAASPPVVVNDTEVDDPDNPAITSTSGVTMGFRDAVAGPAGVSSEHCPYSTTPSNAASRRSDLPQYTWPGEGFVN